jgi:hypothetical protein
VAISPRSRAEMSDAALIRLAYVHDFAESEDDAALHGEPTRTLAPGR